MDRLVISLLQAVLRMLRSPKIAGCREVMSPVTGKTSLAAVVSYPAHLPNMYVPDRSSESSTMRWNTT